jgi:hypothetical protein
VTVTIDISLNLAAHNGEPVAAHQTVEATATNTPGLGVHPVSLGDDIVWAVLHQNTGLRLPWVLATETAAITLADDLKGVTDWTLDAPEINRDIADATREAAGRHGGHVLYECGHLGDTDNASTCGACPAGEA